MEERTAYGNMTESSGLRQASGNFAGRNDSGMTRLPGSNWLCLPGKPRLFATDEELIAVADDWFSQEQRRFHFKDIRAIAARRLPGWFVMNIILAVLTAFTIFIMIADENYWVLIATGLLVAALALNLLPGPTCSCFVWTAVTTAKLPAVTRLAGFRKMMVFLQPKIEAVQGRIAAEDISAITGEISNPDLAASASENRQADGRGG